MGYLDTAGDLGTILSEIEANRAKGRVDAAGVNQSQDRTAYEAARLNLQAPMYRSSNAVKGDVLANAQDFHYGAPRMVGNIPVPTSTGGLRPSILSPQTRALGKLQSAQALQGAMTNNGNVASVTPLPQAGALDKGLGLLGTAGTLAGALAKNGNGAGGSIDLGQLYKDIFHHGEFGTPGDVTGNYNPADFEGVDPNTGQYPDQGPSQAGDPNAGGLEDFYAWLAEQNQPGAAGANDTPIADPDQWGF